MDFANFAQLLEGVLQGNLDARYEWNAYCRKKKLTPDSIEQALSASQEELKQNPYNFYALTLRADIYQYGQNGKVDYAAAIELYERAIALGDSAAMNNRANMYQDGLGGKVDYAKAIALYDRAIALGNSSAMINRARMYRDGLGGKVDYKEAIALYDRAIALGNSSAMNHLANMYRNGQGGKVSYAAAIALYDRAIALGESAAMNNRANMYRDGLSGEVDYAAAIALYDRAIALDNSTAMINRAKMYHDSQDGKVDYTAASALYQRAYFIKQDESVLKELYALTTESDSVEARYNFIRCYLKGTDKKHAKAAKKLFLERASELKALLYPLVDQYIDSLPKEPEFTQRLIDFISEVEHDTAYLKYIQLKVDLHNEAKQAVAIYTDDLANRPDLKAKLTAFDFYRLGNLCLQGIENLSPENRIKKWEQACEFFLQGHLKGDRDCKAILIHILRTKESLELGLPAPKYVSGQVSNKEADEQLIDRFVNRMEASQHEASEALLKSQKELIDLVNLLSDRQVPRGIALFKKIISAHAHEPIRCLQELQQCASERYSKNFQWLHYFFRDHDKQANEIYHILKELNVHVKENVDKTFEALKKYTTKPLKNLSPSRDQDLP